MTSFFGKYRGKVVNNIDPLLQGRLITLVPAISELPLSWAMPCVPYAGPNVGFFALPPISANVWVEFEGGDPNFPIWTGCFWGEGEVPANPAVPTTKTIKTETTTLEINDLTQSIALETSTPVGPVKIGQGPDGIQLTIGLVGLKITPQGIELNNEPASLEVTADGITLKNAAASVEVSNNIALKNGTASAVFTPASIGLKNGAASIHMSPADVNINNGALEVM